MILWLLANAKCRYSACNNICGMPVTYNVSIDIRIIFFTLNSSFTLLSSQVIETYQAEGFAFLLKAFNCPNYLEDLTGLSQLYAQTYDDQVCTLLL